MSAPAENSLPYEGTVALSSSFFYSEFCLVHYNIPLKIFTTIFYHNFFVLSSVLH